MNDSNVGATKSASRIPARVVVISSVMFVFLSYWRVAAVVLCDLASTSYYIGGIVEHSIGPAAPWFIVGVMFFSYAVRSVYIESCSMFVRGGVYRIVKESLGRTLAKVAVSALLFDYILTGPISGVSAGQYIMSLLFELLSHFSGLAITPETRDFWKSLGSVIIAIAITYYFFRQNVIGLHESSDKALKIMIATTVMGVIILGWSIVTLFIQGTQNELTLQPTFVPKANPATGQMESPLGFLEGTSIGEQLVNLTGWNWLSVIGMVGFFIAFGHSVLAMSGEETLAQIYREVESPKLKNFQRAAFIVFVYSLLLTGGISVLAVLLIPDEVRMSRYSDNLIGGLAMSVYGPPLARLMLNAFVVGVGSLILAGAVNTAIIGSNGVLNRVAEDGVIPDWFSKPHPRYGTSYRLLYVILGFQLVTILVSRGDVLLLGEAYAFGVVWSFVFNCLAMLVLRFKDPDRPRGFKVPLNLKIRGVEIPIGLGAIFLILLLSAIMNVLTKEIATKAGICFTVALFVVFVATESYRRRVSGADQHEHLDQFNEAETDTVTPETLGLKHKYRKLVAIRSLANLDALDKALDETDPETTDVVTMTAQVRPVGGVYSEPVNLDLHLQELLDAVGKRAEAVGKSVVPILVSTNHALHAILQTVKAIGAQELIIGPSARVWSDVQLRNLASYWDQLNRDDASSSMNAETASVHDGDITLEQSSDTSNVTNDQATPVMGRLISESERTADQRVGEESASGIRREETLLQSGKGPPLTIRMVSGNREVWLDIGGGSRIPKVIDRAAQSVDDLRATGKGVDRVLLLHDGSQTSSDLFRSLLTMLDPHVVFEVVPTSLARNESLIQDIEEARRLKRITTTFELSPGADFASELVHEIQQRGIDVVVARKSVANVQEKNAATLSPWVDEVLSQTNCQVLVAAETAEVKREQ